MNLFKLSNFILMSWVVEALSQDVEQAGDEPIDFAVGGQAVIEGVMMRSPNHITIAVRKPNNEVSIKEKKYQTLTQRFKWLNIPILRGVVNLFEMMFVGTEAINYSANEAFDEEPESEGHAGVPQNTKMNKALEILMLVISFVFAISLSIFLFKFVPLWLTTFFESKSAYIEQNYVVFNLIDGFIKMGIFIGYIFILGLFPSFRRVFEYHGAEHKSIFAYENKKELTPENANKQIRFHPRCGTSFVLIVFVISIIVYTFVPRHPEFWVNLSVRLAFLPLIAGISYEYLKLSAKYAKNPIVKILIQPGLWFQRLTTKEPDTKQLEVGLKSLKSALAMEKSTT